ncbi:hypothetical protein HAX54_044907 [Datura stramonium]|uniref:Uncharacterized protein n=1 Tax=Datura stramonium TaxID=4076 RepID=A0ABS8SPX6_DATST|nr:hypothetical protein [Datura stramonium]
MSERNQAIFETVSRRKLLQQDDDDQVLVSDIVILQLRGVPRRCTYTPEQFYRESVTYMAQSISCWQRCCNFPELQHVLMTPMPNQFNAITQLREERI